MNRLTSTVVLSLLSILLVGCGLSDAEKERIAKVTCAEIKETKNMDSAPRVRLMNEAREKLKLEPYLEGDEEIVRSVKFGTCELLVHASPGYKEKTLALQLEFDAAIEERERIEAEEFTGGPKNPRETWEKAVNSYFDEVQGATDSLIYNPDDRAFRLRGEFRIKVSNVKFKKFGDASLSGRLTIVWKNPALPEISEEVSCFTSALENPCIASLKVPHLALFRRKLTKGNVLSEVRVMTYQILEVDKAKGDIKEIHSYYYPELESSAKLSRPIAVSLKIEK
jgi:hypothetical protein